MAYDSLIKDQIITSGDMSQASITSEVVPITLGDNVGIQLNFTGTPEGTFEVQVSIDHMQDMNGNVSVAGNWIPLTFSSVPSATGSADEIYLDMNQLSAPWLRVVYTRSAGSGTLNAFVTYKRL